MSLLTTSHTNILSTNGPWFMVDFQLCGNHKYMMNFIKADTTYIGRFDKIGTLRKFSAVAASYIDLLNNNKIHPTFVLRKMDLRCLSYISQGRGEFRNSGQGEHVHFKLEYLRCKSSQSTGHFLPRIQQHKIYRQRDTMKQTTYKLPVILPKTFSTRRGPLALFSENVFTSKRKMLRSNENLCFNTFGRKMSSKLTIEHYPETWTIPDVYMKYSTNWGKLTRHHRGLENHEINLCKSS